MFEKEKLTFSCPNCGAKNSIKAGDAETIGKITCCGCERIIEIEGKSVGKALREVDKSVADLKKAVADINKLGKRR